MRNYQKNINSFCKQGFKGFIIFYESMDFHEEIIRKPSPRFCLLKVILLLLVEVYSSVERRVNTSSNSVLVKSLYESGNSRLSVDSM